MTTLTVKDPLLTAQDVANALGVKPRTIREYRSRREPFFYDRVVRVGGALRWKTSDLNAYIESLEYQPEKEK